MAGLWPSPPPAGTQKTSEIELPEALGGRAPRSLVMTLRKVVHPNPGAPSTRTISPGRVGRQSSWKEDQREMKIIPHVGDALVSKFSNAWRLQQSLWENRLGCAAENDEGEGGELCGCICPRSKKKLRRRSQHPLLPYVET